MGIEPYLISSALTLVVAQRLVRKLCPHCRTPLPEPAPVYRTVGIAAEECSTSPLYKGGGCRHCNSTGFKGRIAVYELMLITEKGKELILERAPLNDSRQEMVRQACQACGTALSRK